MLTCSQYVLTDVESKNVLRFDGQEYLTEARQVTFKISAQQSKNFNHTLGSISLLQSVKSYCYNEERRERLYSNAGGCNRKKIIVSPQNADMFKKLLTILQN